MEDNLFRNDTRVRGSTGSREANGAQMLHLGT
jgi:hypothetical protein